MRKLRAGDLSGVTPPLSQFLELRDQEPLMSNPRDTEEDKAACVATAGLNEDYDKERYPHLTKRADRDLLAWAVRRGSGCIWLEGSERTYVRGFKHRLITKEPPVRQGLHRLSRESTEWIEKAVREDVKRGQLVKGTSEWGFPAFPTKESAAHKAIHWKRRIVVDYRALNRVTVRKVFLIPNSETLKVTLLGLSSSLSGTPQKGSTRLKMNPMP